MTVTAYYSADASAPTLTGSAGSLVALLDACLVNGYGAKAGAGWSIAYTGTNKRDYKQGAGSNGYYLDVDDSGPTTAKEARMRGFEAMTALGTGTMPFPTTAQLSPGIVCRKSASADATARPWYLIADATCFYLFVDTGDYTGPNYAFGFMFGDFFSYKSGDTYNTAIMGRGAENSNDQANDNLAAVAKGPVALNPTVQPWIAGQYVDRTWTGVGGSTLFAKFSSVLAIGNSSSDNSGNGVSAPGGGCAVCNYPNGPDGALELAPIWIGHSGSVRGYLKGLWAPCHNQPCGHGDTFTGTGNMAGKSLLALNVKSYAAYGTNSGQIAVETSNTWS